MTRGSPLLFIDVAHREAEAALIVDSFEANFHFLTNFEGIFDLIEAFVGNLRNVEHTIDAWHDVYKCTKVLN